MQALKNMEAVAITISVPKKLNKEFASIMPFCFFLCFSLNQSLKVVVKGSDEATVLCVRLAMDLPIFLAIYMVER